MAADYKVMLEYDGDIAVFEASAIVPEQRRATYDSYQLVHMPTDLYAYRSTGGRSFGVSGKLVSRNASEANSNARMLDLIRKWILPDFGKTGAPPPIVKFSAYKNYHIDKLNVVITDYNFTFDDLTDYIYDVDDPMPVIGMLSVGLLEVYSADEVTKRKWEITPRGNAGGDDGYVVNENSNPATFSFTRSSDMFGAVSGGGGGGGGFSGISSSGGGGNGFVTESFNQSTSVSRNPFFVGDAAASANGVLLRASGAVRAIDPLSGVTNIVVDAVVDGFDRIAETIAPPSSVDLDDV